MGHPSAHHPSPSAFVVLISRAASGPARLQFPPPRQAVLQQLANSPAGPLLAPEKKTLDALVKSFKGDAEAAVKQLIFIHNSHGDRVFMDTATRMVRLLGKSLNSVCQAVNHCFFVVGSKVLGEACLGDNIVVRAGGGGGGTRQ